MKTLKLWLLRWRAAHLEAQIEHGSVLLLETRARLQQAHQRLRQTRSKIAEATPARELLDEMVRRRPAANDLSAAEQARLSYWGASGERPATEQQRGGVASRHRDDYR